MRKSIINEDMGFWDFLCLGLSCYLARRAFLHCLTTDRFLLIISFCLDLSGGYEREPPITNHDLHLFVILYYHQNVFGISVVIRNSVSWISDRYVYHLGYFPKEFGITQVVSYNLLLRHFDAQLLWLGGFYLEETCSWVQVDVLEGVGGLWILAYEYYNIIILLQTSQSMLSLAYVLVFHFSLRFNRQNGSYCCLVLSELVVSQLQRCSPLGVLLFYFSQGFLLNR